MRAAVQLVVVRQNMLGGVKLPAKQNLKNIELPLGAW